VDEDWDTWVLDIDTDADFVWDATTFAGPAEGFTMAAPRCCSMCRWLAWTRVVVEGRFSAEAFRAATATALVLQQDRPLSRLQLTNFGEGDHMMARTMTVVAVHDCPILPSYDLDVTLTAADAATSLTLVLDVAGLDRDRVLLVDGGEGVHLAAYGEGRTSVDLWFAAADAGSPDEAQRVLRRGVPRRHPTFTLAPGALPPGRTTLRFTARGTDPANYVPVSIFAVALIRPAS